MVNLTERPVMIAPAGIALVVIVWLAPAGFASGTTTEIAPEERVRVVGGAVAVNDICWLEPLQMVAAVGLTEATSGPTVRVATPDRNNGVHPPPIATWNWCPFMAGSRLVRVSVLVVAPLYIPPLLTMVQGEVA